MMGYMVQSALNLFEAFSRLSFQSGRYASLKFHNSHQFLAKFLDLNLPQLWSNSDLSQILKNDDNLSLHTVFERKTLCYSIFLNCYFFDHSFFETRPTSTL